MKDGYHRKMPFSTPTPPNNFWGNMAIHGNWLYMETKRGRYRIEKWLSWDDMEDGLIQERKVAIVRWWSWKAGHFDWALSRKCCTGCVCVSQERFCVVDCIHKLVTWWNYCFLHIFCAQWFCVLCQLQWQKFFV